MKQTLLTCLFVCGLLVAAACDRTQAPEISNEAQKTTKIESATRGASQTSTPKEAPPKGEPSLEDQMIASKGKACEVDSSCAGYLRCVAQTCAVPPAVTGVATKSTPRALFFSEKEKKSEVASFLLELATNDQQRARGLMYRRSMKEDWGMLFVYGEDRPLSFWMKNTVLPLDMVFIKSDGMVAGVIESATPLTLEPRTIGVPARYVLELGSGIAAKTGVKKGTWFDLKNVSNQAWLPQAK